MDRGEAGRGGITFVPHAHGAAGLELPDGHRLVLGRELVGERPPVEVDHGGAVRDVVELGEAVAGRQGRRPGSVHGVGGGHGGVAGGGDRRGHGVSHRASVTGMPRR
nr:hypothetical protein DA06_20845 [Georgenia sp. SUBG003]